MAAVPPDPFRATDPRDPSPSRTRNDDPDGSTSTVRYLMLEDVETGDIVCPLVYLREVFGLNYSRKTSNDRTRVIHEVPDGLIRPPVMTAQNLLQQQLMRARQQQMNGGKPAPPPADPLPCWKLPFESSTDVKLQIRNLLGDEGFSKGHVRLVSLPLAFNVLSEKDEFRDSPLFRAVHHVLKGTSYAQLLRRKRPALKEDAADDEVAMNGDSNAPVGVPNNEGLRMNSFNASTTDFVLVDCVPPPCAGVTVKIEAATAPGETDAGGSHHASLKKVSSGRKNEALKGPRDMQKSFDKYVDYITPDNMTKSGARSGSSRGTAGDNGEGLRGNSFTGPSRVMPPPAAQEPSMLGGGADMSVRMVLDQDGRFSKMRRVSNTSTSPGGSGGWIGGDGQICVDPMEIVSRQREEIHRLKQQNDVLHRDLTSVKSALSGLLSMMTDKEKLDIQQRRKGAAAAARDGGHSQGQYGSDTSGALRSTETDVPVDANGFYAGPNASIAGSMLHTIESVHAAAAGVVGAGGDMRAAQMPGSAQHRPEAGILSAGWGNFGSAPGPMAGVPMRTGSTDQFLHGTSDSLGGMQLEGGADGYVQHH